jgi:hypothetical protein
MADCFTEDTQALRNLSTPARNNYFYGKLLDVQHFTLEQRYFNNKRWLLNRLGYGSGVMCGLQLTVVDGRLVLLPGVAIDPLGREIVVPVPTPIDPRQVTDECGKPLRRAEGRFVTICLAYHPCATELVPVLVSDCDQRDGCAPSTIRESFAVLVREGEPEPYTPDCAIDGLFGPVRGREPPTTEAVYARLIDLVGDASANVDGDECVVLGQVALPSDDAGLADKHVQDVGRKLALNNTLLFQLILCLWDRVEQIGATPTPTPTPTPARLATIEGIRILRTGGAVDNPTARQLAVLDAATQHIEMQNQQRPDVIEIVFGGAGIDPASVSGRNIVVTRTAPAPAARVPLQIQVIGDKAVRFGPKGQEGMVAQFSVGEYSITLVGEDAAAIRAPGGGARLDGDRDGAEGGNFVVTLSIVEGERPTVRSSRRSRGTTPPGS